MLNLTQKRHGQTTILRCSGRIVFPEADCLRTAVLQLPRTRKLVLDLADVITIDAAGLGILVSLYHWAKKARTELRLMNVGSTVQSLLEMTRINTLLELCSVQEMIELLYGSSDETEGSLRLNRHSTPGSSCSETGQDADIGG